MTRDQMRAFMEWMLEPGKSAKTARDRFGDIRRWFRWLVEEGEIDAAAFPVSGQLCETAPADVLHRALAHPCTASLLVPIPDAAVPPRPAPVTGEPPAPLAPPPGCRFHPRAQDRRRTEEPEVRAMAPGHYTARHFPLV